MLYNETLDAIPLNTIPLNEFKKMSNFCTVYIVLFAIFFITNLCISSVSIYFHWYLGKDNVCVKFNPSIQTTIY